MSIKDFELYHGIVLTKIVRNDNPVSLRMIETNKDEAWSAYRINDTTFLYIKYRTRPRKTKRPKGLSWVFIFGEDELQQIKNLKKHNPVYLALVCIDKAPNSICLLEPTEIEQCIDLNVKGSQNITVLYQRNKNLRAYGPLNSNDEDKLVVPQSRLDKWTVPGS